MQVDFGNNAVLFGSIKLERRIRKIRGLVLHDVVLIELEDGHVEAGLERAEGAFSQSETRPYVLIHNLTAPDLAAIQQRIDNLVDTGRVQITSGVGDLAITVEKARQALAALTLTPDMAAG